MSNLESQISGPQGEAGVFSPYPPGRCRLCGARLKAGNHVGICQTNATCRREYKAAYRLLHPDANARWCHRWYERHRDHAAEYQRHYRARRRASAPRSPIPDPPSEAAP